MGVPRVYPSHYPNPRMTRGSGAAADLRQPSEACTQATHTPLPHGPQSVPSLPPCSAGHLEQRLEHYVVVVVDMVTVLIGLVVFGGLAAFCLLLTL